MSFAEVRLSSKEGSGFVEVVLLKDEGAVGPVSVLLSTQDGTATGERFMSGQLLNHIMLLH